MPLHRRGGKKKSHRPLEEVRILTAVVRERIDELAGIPARGHVKVSGIYGRWYRFMG